MSWNFHGRIAWEVEQDARRLLPDKVNDANYRETIFSADGIESGHFVETMMLLLRHQSGYKHNDDVDDFIKNASEYIEKCGHDIPQDEAQSLFDRYRELLERL